MLEKEKFVLSKDEVDRDLTVQVSDRLTIDRNRTKGHGAVLLLLNESK